MMRVMCSQTGVVVEGDDIDDIQDTLAFLQIMGQDLTLEQVKARVAIADYLISGELVEEVSSDPSQVLRDGQVYNVVSVGSFWARPDGGSTNVPPKARQGMVSGDPLHYVLVPAND